MTLLLAVSRGAGSVLVADRRLTAVGIGNDVRVVDDDSTKAGVLNCRDARLGYAFSGLARVGNPPARGPTPPGTFRTSQWLVEAIHDSAAPEREIELLLERFREKAEKTINGLRVPHPKKPLAVLFVGHRESGEPYVRVVHNTPDDGSINSTPRFRIHDLRGDWPAGVVIGVGMLAGWTDERAGAIRALIDAEKPAEALRGKMLSTLEEFSEDKRSKGLIGKQASSLVIPADPSLAVVGQYHSALVTDRAYLPDIIEAGSDASFMTMDRTVSGLTESGDPTPIAGPKLRRNMLCWCGSGKRYKQCHGRYSSGHQRL